MDCWVWLGVVLLYLPEALSLSNNGLYYNYYIWMAAHAIGPHLSQSLSSKKFRQSQIALYSFDGK